jgi:hypothetical protein
MATYWLPVGRPDPGTNVNAIIRAFCDVFDDCSLWNATPFDLMLVGTRSGGAPVSEPEFVTPWSAPDRRARFSDIGLELPQQIGATFLGDSVYLRQLIGSHLPSSAIVAAEPALATRHCQIRLRRRSCDHEAVSGRAGSRAGAPGFANSA